MLWWPGGDGGYQMPILGQNGQVLGMAVGGWVWFCDPGIFFSDSDLSSAGGKNTFRAIAVDVGALNSIFFDFCHFSQKSRKIVKNREKVPLGTRQNFSINFRISQKYVGNRFRT